nr:uncharacterized protein LOC112722259 [Arachis hypogaea]
MDVNDRLDFELEDEFLKPPPIVSNKRYPFSLFKVFIFNFLFLWLREILGFNSFYYLTSKTNELTSVVELAAEKGDNFLEGLLINGWLPKLAFLCGHIEKPVAIWSFNTSE